MCFALCGGGGLLFAHYWLAHKPNALVIGAEPAEANDASISLQAGEIIALTMLQIPWQTVLPRLLLAMYLSYTARNR